MIVPCAVVSSHSHFNQKHHVFFACSSCLRMHAVCIHFRVPALPLVRVALHYIVAGARFPSGYPAFLLRASAKQYLVQTTQPYLTPNRPCIYAPM